MLCTFTNRTYFNFYFRLAPFYHRIQRNIIYHRKPWVWVRNLCLQPMVQRCYIRLFILKRCTNHINQYIFKCCINFLCSRRKGSSNISLADNQTGDFVEKHRNIFHLERHLKKSKHFVKENSVLKRVMKFVEGYM